MEIKGSQTENNLRSIVSGEAQSALLYDLFAEKAEADGFEGIAAVLRETAGNERAHAKIFLDLLECISFTGQNLISAAETEKHESGVLYPQFAAEARAEGLIQVAETMERIAEIEREHEARFRSLEESVRTNAVFAGKGSVVWICRNCGHRVESPEAPAICPVCKHPRAYFETV